MKQLTRHKTFLLIAGIFLSLIVLEAGLRLAGFTWLSIREQANRAALKQKGSYRIMCLGESTTFQQYPLFLQQALDRSSRGIKFSVIDKGTPSTSTPYILWELPANLEKYKPDMVVAMMGINDAAAQGYFAAGQAGRFGSLIHSLQTYKLFRIIWQRILAVMGLKTAYADAIPSETRLKESIQLNPLNYYAYLALGNFYQEQGDVPRAGEMFAKADQLNPHNGMADPKKIADVGESFEKTVKNNPDNIDAYMYLGHFLRDQGQIAQAIEAFEKAAKLNPNNSLAYLYLGWFYRDQGKYPQAEAALKEAVKIDQDNAEAYMYLGWFYLDQGQYALAREMLGRAENLDPKDNSGRRLLALLQSRQNNFLEAENTLKQAIKISPNDADLYVRLSSLYLDQGKIPQAGNILQRAAEIIPDDDRAYRALSALYASLGKPDLAKDYAARANKLGLEYYKPITAENYRKLKEILDKKGIRLVCVQYPMRSIKPLKRIFRNNPEGVIFVDNEKVFKEAVLKEGRKEYFVDMFGGDFGHCTAKGNRLLGENIAKAILKALF